MDNQTEKILAILGPHGSISRNWDFMRDLVGEAWEDSLTDMVFLALFVNKKRQHPKPSGNFRADIGKTVEWLPRDFLSKWIADALKSKDAAFFLRLGKSMEALNKVWPNGINEAMEPPDKWRWTAARFIKKHWDKHGCAPSQTAVREHLEAMEHYHGKAPIQTMKPLPMEGSFQHVDRKPGRPRKNPPGKSSGAV
jgi:hypothetical protein